MRRQFVGQPDARCRKSLPDALLHLEQNPVLPAAMGSEFVASYLELKHQALQEYTSHMTAEHAID